MGFNVECDSGFTVSFQGGVEGVPSIAIALTAGYDRVCCGFNKVGTARLNHQTIWYFCCLKLCPQQRPTRQNAQARNTAAKDRFPVINIRCIGRKERNLHLIY